MSRLIAALLLSVGLACSPAASRAAPQPALEFIERVFNAAPNDKLPMLIALHGLGDAPEKFVELFTGLELRVRIIAVRAPDPYPVGSSWFPIDDPKRAPGAILERAAQLAEFADHLAETRPTVGRPLITGFSQGGILSFAVAAYHAEHFQAALPIAGSLLDALPRYRRAPKGFVVTAFHGRDDTRIPYAGAERTVARMNAAGTLASLTGFAGLAHSISPALYERYVAALTSALTKLR
jgi:phospholipase/carboxylesterase